MSTEINLFKKAENLYFAKGKENQAIDAFKELLEKYPRNHKGWSMISTLLFGKHKYDDAIDAIDRAIELEPNEKKYYDEKATHLSLISHMAFQDGEYIDNRYLDSDNTAYVIKRYKDRANLLKELLITLDKIIKEEKDNILLIDNLRKKASILEGLKQYDEAIKTYEKIIKLTDDEMDVEDCISSIGYNYEKSGRFNLALKYYDKLIAMTTNPHNFTYKIKLLQKMGNQKQADELTNDFVEKATKKFQKSTDAAYVFQIVHLLLGKNNPDPKRALEIFSELSPKARTYKGLDDRFKELKEEIDKANSLS